MTTDPKYTLLSSRLKKFTIAIIVLWTVAFVGSLAWNIVENLGHMLSTARIQAGHTFNENLVYGRWVASHGGVYVPVTEKTPPNPYLSHVPNRDFTTPWGQKMTLMNPAYMTRQAHELGQEEFGLKGHLTSLNLLRPENAPDNWERKSLQEFETGVTEVVSRDTIAGDEYLRLMRPLFVEEACLKCHAQQGYKLGDIRGGISVSIPLEPLLEVTRVHIFSMAIGYTLVWMLGLIGLALGARRLRISLRERLQAEQQLKIRAYQQEVLAEVGQKALSNIDFDTLLDEVVATTAETLNVKFCKVLELTPGGKDLLLKAGVGWKKGLVGKAIVGSGSDSQAGYTLSSRTPVIVNNLQTEQRFSVPPLLSDHNIVSGISVIIHGIDQPYGTLGAHSSTHRTFTREDTNFLQTIANILAERFAIYMARRELENQAQDLQRSNIDLEQFASAASHDLQTPLRTVSGFANLLAERYQGKLDQDADEYLDHIQEGTEQMSSMIKGLLQISGIQTKNLEFERVAMDNLIQDVLNVFGSLIEDCEATITYEGLPHIFAMPTLIRQLVQNLIENALKFKGADPPLINISAQQVGLEWVFRIEDNGIGINPSDQKRIFDVFHRIPGNGTRPGTGVGLALCQRIIVRHSGKIWVESEGEDQGSTFCFSIPM